MSKIVILTNIPAPYRVDLFYYLQMHIMEHEFHVIYTSMNEDNRQWTLQKEKMLNSHVLNSRVIKIKGKLDDRYIHFPWNLLKILKEINPSIVIAGEYNPAALQSMAWCKLYNKKFIHLTDGTLFSERNIGKFQKIARKIICSQADACIASSTKAKEKLLKWGVKEKKIFVSLLTVDTTKYKNLKREPINGRILYVGSMVKRKGLDLLIDALQYVQCDFELHIVGNGNDAENNALKSAIKEKGMDSRVVFCGFKEGDKLLDEYAHAQLFVLPTREDCFGLVLLEAACAGVPIISSKYADGAYDIVQENINGFIIDPYDAKHFGDTIDIALNNKKLMKDVSGECIDKFSFPKVIAGYIDAFSYVMKGKN